ncbi:MAG: cytochrome c oxidase subunit 3 [Bacteroidota bacterium]|nr:cytochrome c oxidase subunit 3 [Bacteroidota bacterium]
MVMVKTQPRQKRHREQYPVHPARFTLWLFLGTVTMLFAAFTSSLIVSKTQNAHWAPIEIPGIFTISTVIIALSSATMLWAYISARKNEIDQNRLALWATLGLCIAFVVMQYVGYQVLVQNEIFLSDSTGNTAGSFFYVISGVHALHVIGGFFILLNTLLSSYNYRVHSKSMLNISLCATYWHFIGGLWLYLFAILKIYA